MRQLLPSAKNLPWHLLYLGLIAASVYFLRYQERDRRSEWAAQVKIDRLMAETLSREADMELSRLKKEQRDYPDARHDYLLALGQQLDSLSRRWSQLSHQMGEQGLAPADFAAQSTAVLSALQQVANQDTLLANVYKKAWPNWSVNAWMSRLSPHPPPDERRALLLNGQIQVFSALYLALYRLNWQLALEEFSPEHFTVVPLVSTEGIPRVGEPCRLSFGSGVAASDPQGDSLIRIFVNGREYPVERGLAHYEQKFDTPGEHVLNVEARLQSPFEDGRVEVMRREFKVKVLPRGR